MIRKSLLALACASVCALPFGAPRRAVCHATTVVRLELADLVARADTILEARVVSRSVVATAARHCATEYVLRPVRTFLGAEAAEIVVRFPGGVLPDGSGLVIPGMPALAVDEVALLFLGIENARGERLPIGLAQGRWRVAVDGLGRKTFVRDSAGLELVDPQGRPLPVPPGPAARPDHDAIVAELERLVTLERSRREQEKR